MRKLPFFFAVLMSLSGVGYALDWDRSFVRAAPGNDSFLLPDAYLTSPNGKYFAIVQMGNISVFKGSDPSRNEGFQWNTGFPITPSNDNFFMVLQGDGNICIYKGQPESHQPNGSCVMSNSGNDDYFMIIQDDANLVVYKGTGPGDNRGPVWSHQTGRIDQSRIDPVERILIGSTDFLPCSRMEWNQIYNATLRTAPQRLFAYATINRSKLKNSGSDLKYCAEQSLATCAVASLISNGSACLPAFKARLATCLQERNVSDIANYVSLTSETRCMW